MTISIVASNAAELMHELRVLNLVAAPAAVSAEGAPARVAELEHERSLIASALGYPVGGPRDLVRYVQDLATDNLAFVHDGEPSDQEQRAEALDKLLNDVALAVGYEGDDDAPIPGLVEALVKNYKAAEARLAELEQQLEEMLAELQRLRSATGIGAIAGDSASGVDARLLADAQPQFKPGDKVTYHFPKEPPGNGHTEEYTVESYDPTSNSYTLKNRSGTMKAAPAERVVASEKKTTRKAERFTVRKEEAPNKGFEVVETESGVVMEVFALKREAQTHADKLNAEGMPEWWSDYQAWKYAQNGMTNMEPLEWKRRRDAGLFPSPQAEQEPETKDQPQTPPPADKPKSEGNCSEKPWTAPLPKGARVMVDSVGYTGPGVILDQTKIDLASKEPDGYIIDTGRGPGKGALARFNTVVLAPEEPIEPATPEASQTAPQADTLPEAFARLPEVTPAPELEVIVLLEDGSTPGGKLVKNFEGTTRWEIALDKGGCIVLDASFIRGYPEKPTENLPDAVPVPEDRDAFDPDRHSPPTFITEASSEVPEDRLVNLDERRELAEFAKARKVGPDRIRALIEKHFGKADNKELTVSELPKLRELIQAEADAHVF